jgi:hypothetical protein
MNATPDTAPRIMAEYSITDLASAQAMLEGRIALGYTVVGAAAMAYVGGRITGNGSFDQQQKEADIQAGWVPRSIKIGDTWVAYDGFEPFHTFLALIGDIGDNTNELGSSITEDWLARVSYVFAQNVTNKSFISGLAPLMQILSGQVGEGATTIGANTLNNLIPYGGLRNAVANSISPAIRELSDSFQEKFMNRNYDFWTRYINAFTPLTVNADWSETREELRRSGYDLKNAFTTDPDSGIRLDPTTISAMQQEMATYGLEDQLARLFAAPGYRESRDKLQRARDAGLPTRDVEANNFWHFKRIDKIFKDAKKRALLKVRTQTGETEAIRQALTKKKIDAAGRQQDFGAQQFYIDQQINAQ